MKDTRVHVQDHRGELQKVHITPLKHEKHSCAIYIILGEIVQAMHNGLTLKKNCSVNMYVSENLEVIMAVDGSGQRQHNSKVRMEKLEIEFEADYIGLMLMASAEYDPRDAQKFMRCGLEIRKEDYLQLIHQVLREHRS
ncbi:unnamed protein product [Camellia sinensis]